MHQEAYMGYIIDFTVLGSVGTNCYLFMDEQSGKGFIVDPADNAVAIENMIERNKCIPEAVLLTHGHYDHILAATAIKEKYNINIYASEHEADILKEPQLNLSSAMGGEPVSLKADVLLKDGVILELAGTQVTVIHTPGHTKGSSCYYIKEAGVLFSGDTLFAESVGRTDFPTGSMRQITESVKEKLFVLPEETVVFPGHGEGSSISHEMKYNPFCQ